MNATAVYRTDGSLVIRTPYIREFVEEIKDGIPPAARSWDAALKIWVVSGGYQRTAIRILERHYDDVEIETPYSYRKLQPPPFTIIRNEPKSDPDRDLFRVTASASIEIIRASYRVLAKECHPDRSGGSHEKMQRLNAALERLESQVRSEGAA